MKILQVCKKVPWPLEDGESIAVYGLAKGLSELGNELHLLTFNTSKHFRNRDEATVGLDHYENIDFVDVDNKVSFLLLMKNIFSSAPIHVDRLNKDKLENQFLGVLTSIDFDVVIFETVFTSVLDVPESNGILKVIRCHNAEHVIWQRMLKYIPFWKRWYFKIQSLRLKKFEFQRLSKTDLIITLSEQDKTNLNLERSNNTIVSGIGLSLSRYKNENKGDREKVKFCYLGSLDWMPNVHGLKWFINEVWNQLYHYLLKEIELHIAGKGSLELFQNESDKSIFVHGRVEDSIEFYKSNDCLVVPLFAGSGQKVKILEALALDIPVITTPIGMEGIQNSPQMCHRATNANAFKEAILKIYQLKSSGTGLNLESMKDDLDMRILSKRVHDELLLRINSK